MKKLCFPPHIYINNALILILLLAFILSGLAPIPVNAQELRLPAPGVMVHLSPEFKPPTLKGIKVHPDNPFRFDFILDRGDSLHGDLKQESTKLIKYFLASLTIPEKDLWVNLSPYEKDRIVPNSFGLTEMGRDLLAEDYMLKQITASLIYPEDAIGKKFWKRVYTEASEKFNTTNIPVNTFNKVWIVPEKAVVYENAKAGTAYVVESKLKVMLEQDYLSMSRHGQGGVDSTPVILSPSLRSRVGSAKVLKISLDSSASPQNDVNALGSQIVREIVIPELTKEVNEDKNFAQLRQVYNSLILATWYKKKIKDSILAQVYADKNKIQGLVIPDSTVIPAKGPHAGHSQLFAGTQNKNNVEFIYQRYLQAFKKGVYNYIKEELDPLTQETIPRKYFSGGTTFDDKAMSAAFSEVQTLPLQDENNSNLAMISMQADPLPLKQNSSAKTPSDFAMQTFVSQSLYLNMNLSISRQLLEQGFPQALVDHILKVEKELFKDNTVPVGVNWSGRSLIIPLSKQEQFTIQGRTYKAIRLKGSTYKGKKPNMQPYVSGPNDTVEPSLHDLQIEKKDGSEVITYQPSVSVPQGAMLLKFAQSEYSSMTAVFKAGVPTVLPVGYGEYTDMKFNGEKTGFGIFAEEENPLLVRGATLLRWDRDLFYDELGKSVFSAVKLLGRLHRAGFTHTNPHLGQFGYRKNTEGRVYDFETMFDARSVSRDEFIYRVLNDFMDFYIDVFLVARFNKMDSKTVLLSARESFYNILNGYFTHENLNNIKEEDKAPEKLMPIISKYKSTEHSTGKALADVIKEITGESSVMGELAREAGNTYDQVNRQKIAKNGKSSQFSDDRTINKNVMTIDLRDLEYPNLLRDISEALQKHKRVVLKTRDYSYQIENDLYGGSGRGVYRALRISDRDQSTKTVVIKIFDGTVFIMGVSKSDISNFFSSIENDERAKSLFSQFLGGSVNFNNFNMMVTEFIEGKSLVEIFDLPQRMQVLVNLIEKLAYVHRKYKAFHGDILAQNIKVTPDGQPKLIDWDFLRMLPLSGDIEQVKLNMKYKDISDIGVLLLMSYPHSAHMSTNKILVGDNMFQDIDIKHRSITKLSGTDGVPPGMLNIIKKAVLANPDGNYESLDQLLSDLKRELTAEGIDYSKGDKDKAMTATAMQISRFHSSVLEMNIAISQQLLDQGIPHSLFERILKVQNFLFEFNRLPNGVKWSGRSIIIPLSKQEQFTIQGKTFKSIRLKGTTNNGEKPEIKKYVPGVNELVRSSTYYMQIQKQDDNEVITYQKTYSVPQGAMLLEFAKREYQSATSVFNAGIPTALPVGYGEYINKEFDGKKIGFVIFAEEENPLLQRTGSLFLDRFTHKKFDSYYDDLSRSLFAAVRLLGRLHRAGYTHSNPHLDQFGYQKGSDGRIYDFETMSDVRDGISRDEFIYRVLIDFSSFYRSADYVARLFGKVPLESVLNIQEPVYKNILNGYFSQENLKNIKDEDKNPMRLMEVILRALDITEKIGKAQVLADVLKKITNESSVMAELAKEAGNAYDHVHSQKMEGTGDSTQLPVQQQPADRAMSIKEIYAHIMESDFPLVPMSTNNLNYDLDHFPDLHIYIKSPKRVPSNMFFKQSVLLAKNYGNGLAVDFFVVEDSGEMMVVQEEVINLKDVIDREIDELESRSLNVIHREKIIRHIHESVDQYFNIFDRFLIRGLLWKDPKIEGLGIIDGKVKLSDIGSLRQIKEYESMQGRYELNVDITAIRMRFLRLLGFKHYSKYYLLSDVVNNRYSAENIKKAVMRQIHTNFEPQPMQIRDFLERLNIRLNPNRQHAAMHTKFEVKGDSAQLGGKAEFPLGKMDPNKLSSVNAMTLLNKLKEQGLSWEEIDKVLVNYKEEIYGKTNHNYDSVNQGIRFFLQSTLWDEGSKDPRPRAVIDDAADAVKLILDNPDAEEKILRKMDKAMNVEKGGIDFTANKTPLEIQNSGEGIKFKIDPVMLRQLQNTPGFVPVIINIQPMTDLRKFLGIASLRSQ